jgi:acetaldehyde dehydrogenase/alcohol dehydrogenase
MHVFKAPSIYSGSCWKHSLGSELEGVKRVLIVSDHTNAAQMVSDMLCEHTEVARYIPIPRLTMRQVRKGTDRIHTVRPGAIVAIGGDLAMDTAKLARALYEDPGKDFRPKPFKLERKYTLNKDRIKLICTPVASGSGSEATPFATLNGDKYSGGARVLDYALIPDAVVVDPDLVAGSGSVYALSHALSRAIESYVSEYANEYTKGYSLRAARLVFQNTSDLHNASTMAGLASANAWNSRSDSIAFALNELYQIPYWLTNAIVLPHVIHRTPFFERAYAEIAVYCGLADPFNATAKDLVKGLERINRSLGVRSKRLRDLKLFTEDDFDRIARLACYDSLQFGFVKQNPSVDGFKQILTDSY